MGRFYASHCTSSLLHSLKVIVTSHCCASEMRILKILQLTVALQRKLQTITCPWKRKKSCSNVTFYFLSDEWCLLVHAITVHLGPKNISVCVTEDAVTKKMTTFFSEFVSSNVWEPLMGLTLKLNSHRWIPWIISKEKPLLAPCSNLLQLLVMLHWCCS